MPLPAHKRLLLVSLCACLPLTLRADVLQSNAHSLASPVGQAALVALVVVACGALFFLVKTEQQIRLRRVMHGGAILLLMALASAAACYLAVPSHEPTLGSWLHRYHVHLMCAQAAALPVALLLLLKRPTAAVAAALGCVVGIGAVMVLDSEKAIPRYRLGLARPVFDLRDAPAPTGAPKFPQHGYSIARGNVYGYAQTMLGFPGGSAGIEKFLATHLKYPPAARDAGVEGVTVVNCIVNPDGFVTDASIAGPLNNTVNPINRTCDREALRVVRRLPRFAPGIANGKPAAMQLEVHISFGEATNYSGQ